MKYKTIAMFFLLALAVLASADQSKLIQTFQYGIFESSFTEAEFEPGDRVVTRDYHTIKQTSMIPAKLGTKFGLRYRLPADAFKKSPELHLIYLTPTMINPDNGTHIDKLEVLQTDSKLDRAHTMAFEFSHLYEIVPGAWHFYIFHNDQKLLEWTFHVVE